MSYADLLERLSSPSFLAYQALLLLSCYLLVASVILGRKNVPRAETSSPFWLKLSTFAVIVSTAIIPLVYRIIPADTFILPWECESVYHYYFALSLKQSPAEFALKSVEENPGVLSASAKSLLYGIPTYFLLHKMGWSVFTLRIVAYAFGLLALIPGYIFAKRLFNPNVALLFVMVLAANTHTIYYMGYGVSPTATLFGLLVALSFCAAAVQARWHHRYPLALIAGLALFAACFNYSTAKIFVVITLASLVTYSVVSMFRWKAIGQSGLAALLIVLTTLGLLAAERHVNSEADFASARGEQALILMQHKEQIINYLGNTPEVQAIEPSTMPLAMKAQFLIAVAKARLPEFLRAFNPLSGSKAVYPRGVFDAVSMLAYPFGLVLILVAGFGAMIVQLRAPRNSFIICLFVGGILPLLLTTRFDSHRSYILIIPVSTMIAWGTWIALRRLRGGWFREIHCALFSFALAAALIAQSWFFMGIRDFQHRNVWLFARDVEKIIQPGTTIALALDCNARALVALQIADVVRINQTANLTLWDPGVGENLLDGQFNPNSVFYERFLKDAARGRAVLLYSTPITQLLNDLKSKPFEVADSSDGTLGTLIVTPKASTP